MLKLIIKKKRNLKVQTVILQTVMNQKQVHQQQQQKQKRGLLRLLWNLKERYETFVKAE